MQLQLICEDPSLESHFSELTSRWGLQHDANSILALVHTGERLELRKTDEPKLGAIFVDLVGVQLVIAESLVAVKVKQLQKRQG